MFMSTNTKENWGNGGTTEQIRNGNERTSERKSDKQQYEQTDSRMTELTMKPSTEFSPVKVNERKTEWTNSRN